MIIHKVTHRKERGFGERVYYLCNEAVNPTLEKIAMSDDEVTCKNCLKQMAKSQVPTGKGEVSSSSKGEDGRLTEKEDAT